MLFASPTLWASSVPEVVAYVTAKPGKLKWARVIKAGGVKVE